MARTEVINTRRTKLMRREVSRSENYVTVLILLLLAGIVVWVLGTRDNFDASERDLPIELLYHGREPIEIYTRPLKPWQEPGSASVSSTVDYGGLPAAIADGQWRPSTRVRRFVADNLYEKINGEAEKFIKQGFVSLDYVALKFGEDGAEIAIELFDQGDIGGSLGIFAEHAASRELQTQDGVTYFLTGAGVIGRTGRYFFRVAADRQSEPIKRKSLDLVRVFASLGATNAQATSSTLPEGFVLLTERLGLREADVQFEESNVFQYDFASQFWFGSAGLNDKSRFFVHIAGNENEAVELLELLVDEQSYEYERLSNDEEWMLFRHKYQSTHFALGRDDRFVYGVEKVSAADDAQILIHRLQAALADD